MNDLESYQINQSLLDGFIFDVLVDSTLNSEVDPSVFDIYHHPITGQLKNRQSFLIRTYR